jgi:hypothetical protein
MYEAIVGVFFGCNGYSAVCCAVDGVGQPRG